MRVPCEKESAARVPATGKARPKSSVGICMFSTRLSSTD